MCIKLAELSQLLFNGILYRILLRCAVSLIWLKLSMQFLKCEIYESGNPAGSVPSLV